MIVEIRQRYVLTDFRDHGPGHYGEPRNPDPDRPTRDLPGRMTREAKLTPDG